MSRAFDTTVDKAWDTLNKGVRYIYRSKVWTEVANFWAASMEGYPAQIHRGGIRDDGAQGAEVTCCASVRVAETR